jgi:hypothetical protein
MVCWRIVHVISSLMCLCCKKCGRIRFKYSHFEPAILFEIVGFASEVGILELKIDGQ